MNCNELKQKLAEKDQEIKSIKEKSIEYFNLIKDDVLDDLINDHIKDNFQSDSYVVSEFLLMLKLYGKLGASTLFLDWDYVLWRTPFEDNMFGVRTGFRDIFDNLDEEQRKVRSENYLKSKEINSSFDYKYFCELLIDYLKSKGFVQKTIKTRRGDVIQRNSFKIARRKLELGCCNDSASSKDSNEFDANVAQGLLGIAILLILGLVIFAKFGGA